MGYHGNGGVADGVLPIVLASGSPRRAELLRQVGLPFEVVTSGVDEEASAVGVRSPREVARRRAAAKAGAVAGLRPGRLVLGADTVVCCRGRILDKPVDARAAEDMLRLLSGRSHCVLTAIALVCRGETTEAVEYARVVFRRLDDAEIRRYAASPEPLDKAGGYALQGAAAAFVRRIAGEYTTVVGLPLCRLSVMLRRYGIRS